MKVILAGGGTGGHLMPALALAAAVRRLDPDAAVTFVGTDAGIEAQKVPQAGYPLLTVRGGQVKGVGPVRALRSLAYALLGVRDAARHLRTVRPDVVVCVGGYAAFAAGVAARLFRIPLVVLEQNAIPGRTNRFLSRLARLVIAPFDAALAMLHGRTRERIANPVRPDLIARFAELRGAKTGPFHVFVFGGSQGAHRLNEATKGYAERVADRLNTEIALTHQTGPRDIDSVRAFYAERRLPVAAHAFIDDMAAAYAAADVVVCRAGATSIAELCALGLPSVLVPYPFAADDHQRANAAVLASAGAARVIEDADFHDGALFDAVEALRTDATLLGRMAQAARSLGAPDAADRVAARVLSISGAFSSGASYVS